MKIMLLGSEGMVGHVVNQYLMERGHSIFRVDDISDLDAVGAEAGRGTYDAVINCLAVINQTAEEDKVAAVRVNALLPHFLEAVTANTKTVVIHRSTDCIFSGAKGSYVLDDWPDAASFYGRSKALGEIKNKKDITIRTSLIGPETDENGRGLFHWFYQQKGQINGFANAIWTGLTTIEYAREIEWLLENRKHGVFQLVPNHAISKYELLLLFEKYYPGNRTIRWVENEMTDKSLVPVCGGVIIPDYETQIANMRRWTDQHRDLYNYQ